MRLLLTAFELIDVYKPTSVCTRLNIIRIRIFLSCLNKLFVGNVLMQTKHVFLLGKNLLVWQALLAIQLICPTTRSQSLLCKNIIDGHVCLLVNFSILLMTAADACLWLVELGNTRVLLNKWLSWWSHI